LTYVRFWLKQLSSRDTRNSHSLLEQDLAFLIPLW
jgi:hypothetical protein